MDEMILMIDVLQCWRQQRISRDQSLEVLATIAHSSKGRKLIEQVLELLRQALELEEFS